MRQNRFHHIATIDCGKVVLAVPFFDVEFTVGIQCTGFEGFEHGSAVAVELHADFIKIALAAHERHIIAPVVWIALEADKAARLKIVYDVFRRGDRDIRHAGRCEILTFPLRFLQHRAHADQKGKLAVLYTKCKADGPLARLLHRGDLVPKTVIARVTNGTQRFVRPHDVFYGDRAAIRELSLFAQDKFSPFTVRPNLNRFGQNAVEREWFVIIAAHQAFMNEKAKLPRNRAFRDQRVQAVKAADFSGDDASTGGSVRVCKGERHKIRWKLRVAIHSYAMLGFCRRCRRAYHEGACGGF